ncbi:hypothetical protein CHELA1G11_11185 [Hyphomicrobiales bacterium]|nr:hypothetical protein CHELA1G11_11185 [Hyphomicrobiales bacterium]
MHAASGQSLPKPLRCAGFSRYSACRTRNRRSSCRSPNGDNLRDTRDRGRHSYGRRRALVLVRRLDLCRPEGASPQISFIVIVFDNNLLALAVASDLDHTSFDVRSNVVTNFVFCFRHDFTFVMWFLSRRPSRCGRELPHGGTLECSARRWAMAHGAIAMG